MADTLQIERELREMTDLQQRQRNIIGKSPNTNYLREIYLICYREKHLASNCRKLNQLSQQIYNAIAPEIEILIYQICKKRGHNAGKCRLRDPQTWSSVNVIQRNRIQGYYLSIMLEIWSQC